MRKTLVFKSNGKPRKTSVKTWADRQKAAGVRLELSQHKPRNHWKKMVDGKYHYFKHPITKAGYESALREWLNLKAEMDFEKPYLALIQHHIDIFKAVQNYFDHAVEQTTKEKKMAQQVDQFINWLETAFDDPDQYIPEVDPSTSLTQDEIDEFEIVKPDISPEENNFRWAVMSALRGKSELADNIVRRFFGEDHIGTLTFQLPEEWKEKTEFTESPEKLPQTVGYWAEDFLNLKGAKADNNQLTTTTARDSREKLKKFRIWIGDKTPITNITSETLKQFYLHLLQQDFNNKQNYFNYSKSFIRYAWREDACNLENLPKNIDDRGTFSFRGTTKKQQTKNRLKELWTKEDFKKVIAKNSTISERYQCWILLMLNCGYTQTDLNELKRDEVDLKTGRIIRCRTKAENYSNAPIVNYKLWNVTLELLKKEMKRSTDPVYALQATKGARLIKEEIKKDSSGKFIATKHDNTSRGWQKIRKEAGLDKILKYIRKTGATTIKSESKHKSEERLYLGHTPDNMADLHYNIMEGQVYKPLDEAIGFLGKQFGLK
ncbi:MAG: hypothetical protein CME33_25465 [Gimesia sp.]|uniref:hypothetical protein n=1 Tax=Gimesia sp. TaxID=2024833 RepID=UPI000C5E152F|nr:hypothetical protein [Gimesia sp.]MAX39907.1 hypothetical protein [Gimesia sp.]|tara:strand:+ start:731 stop:2371 length:1641 start_codon:yes stop_codon:yes gene_type:complete